jgi:hypothetical protein
MTLLPATLLTVINSSSSLEKNTDLDLPEIGPLRDLTYKESSALLLKVMSVSTDLTYSEWEFFLFNSTLKKVPLLSASPDLRNSPSTGEKTSLLTSKLQSPLLAVSPSPL